MSGRAVGAIGARLRNHDQHPDNLDHAEPHNAS
jgi:hypothetical protein